ncbi:CHASE2 domain-containing protein [Pannus brasiliensis CCIBt3594]|uniref:histidine kinase n=1 Tax=Pannus brasiliensis CCIBt3594 TaxID=1427578 RepID=A0AAW9QWB3_9CHRO
MVDRARRGIMREWWGVWVVVPSVGLLITALRLMGWFQPAEWTGYDLFLQLRPRESPDSRIVIVGLEESDIQKYRQWPVSDRLLARLITRIHAGKPRAIGLDLHRDLPVPPGNDESVRVFQKTPNLIGIQKVNGDGVYGAIAPPPVLAGEGRIGASDALLDGDGVLRRAILFPRTKDNPALPSFGLALALAYLEKEGIRPIASQDGGWMQLRNTVFYPLDRNAGGYVGIGTAEYQILLNFRGSAGTFPTVSFADVLEGRIPANFFHDKIVLIGSRAVSLKDYFFTPYSKGFNTNALLVYGVEIHANLASQILATALDKRPLLQTWTEPVEYLWIWAWIALAASWGWRGRSTRNSIGLLSRILLGTSLMSIGLIGGSYLLFLGSWWVPLVPALAGVLAGSAGITIALYIDRLRKAKDILEKTVQERTEELYLKNERLEKTLEELTATQQQIIAQEKLAYLGMLSAGINHEIRNPVNLIDNFADLSLEAEREVRERIEDCQDFLPENYSDEIREELSLVHENIETIKNQTRRITLLIQALSPRVKFREIEPELTDIHSLLDTAARLVFYTKKVSDSRIGVKLETDYDRSLEPIAVIVPEITQVFVNLIDNAYDAIYQRSRTEIVDYEPTIIIATRDRGDFIEIQIADNGIGIDPGLREKIFQPFVTTKPPGKGSGLGLSIARDIIVGKDGGKLQLVDGRSNYTTFSIELPKK